MRRIITESYYQIKYKLRCREREKCGDADELYERYARGIVRHGASEHDAHEATGIYNHTSTQAKAGYSIACAQGQCAADEDWHSTQAKTSQPDTSAKTRPDTNIHAPSDKDAFLNDDALNLAIAEKIRSGEPFMLGRFGAVELFNMRTDEFRHASNAKKACAQLYDCAGFFPNDQALLPRFNACMKDACAMTDYLGVWFNPAEDYFIKKYCTNLRGICRLSAIEPWRSAQPWSAALKGKKVLIVHPFESSIRTQYAKRELLFENPDILPDFTLLTLKAVQTAGDETDERFPDWFAALDFMCAECDKLDFDIALIGCGAYGFPLAAHVRSTGRQAVHFGGSLQILFGIRGDRWDRFIPDVVAMYNEHWNYPLESEVPGGSVNVEGGTYWKGSN